MKTQNAFRTKSKNFIQVIHGSGQHVTAPTSFGAIYEFDEGQKIGVGDGTLGVCVIGGTGRGKTQSFIAPFTRSLIEQGLSGLICDVKNNFTDQVRQIAAGVGRAGDIVEIGTHPTSMPINALAGLNLEEIEQVLHSLIITPLDHGRSHNMDFTLRGFELAMDFIWLLLKLSRKDRLFTPSFALLDRCVNEQSFAKTVFRLFLDQVYDSNKYEHAAFVNRVRNDEFHLLTKEEKKKRADRYYEQLGYRLSCVRAALSPLVRDKQVLNSFSAPEGAVLDYRELLAENKIVIIRFKPGQSFAARLLGRFVKEKFYQDVYRLLDGGNAPKNFFFIGDEFQDVMPLEHDNPFGDFSWFSKSRESGCVNIIASQSLSSLYACGKREAVDSLFANCSTKIVLQNDDPAADAFFRHFCGLEKTLAQLGPGEALVSRYDMVERQQKVAHLHFDNAYQRNQMYSADLPIEETRRRPGMSVEAQMEALSRLSQNGFLRYLKKPLYALYRRHDSVLVPPDELFYEVPAERFRHVSETLNEFQIKFERKAKVKSIVEFESSLFLEVDGSGLSRKMKKQIKSFVLEVLDGRP